MIYLIGVSKDVPINIREQLSMTNSKLKSNLVRLKEIVCGCVILSTCNRTEIYLEGEIKFDEILETLGFNSFKEYFYIKTTNDCVEHLFNVSCGFDSKILGEEQILGQVKDALIISEGIGSISGNLKRMFDMAIACGREFRQKSKLIEFPISSSSIAVNISKKNRIKRYMLIGFGDVNSLSLKYILDSDFDFIYIVVRDINKVDIDDKRIRVIDFKEKNRFIQYVECIISATSAPHFVLKKDEIENFKGYIFDLAVPRDVEYDDCFKDIIYYDVDKISAINDENIKLRKHRMIENRYIVYKYVGEFINYLNLREISCSINKIKQHSNGIYKKRYKTYINKHPNCDKKTLEILFKSTADAFSNRAIEVLKEEYLNGRGEECLRIIEKIFMI
ncbi:MAG: glutamyl-tRNA reductase [Clostridiales bacterium]|nr:glutamyl-tRNA reductase [Clostridiales bacterium]